MGACGVGDVKRELSYWVVKKDDSYVDAQGYWVKSRLAAVRWPTRDLADTFIAERTGSEDAACGIFYRAVPVYFRPIDTGLYYVRLRRKYLVENWHGASHQGFSYTFSKRKASLFCKKKANTLRRAFALLDCYIEPFASP